MSLLMKALSSAEKEKQEKQQASSEVGKNEDNTEVQSENSRLSTSGPAIDKQLYRQSAANIFTASQPPAQSFSKIMWTLLLIAIALIAWFGLQFYLSQTHINESNFAQLTQNQSTTPAVHVATQEAKPTIKSLPIATHSKALMTENTFEINAHPPENPTKITVPSTPISVKSSRKELTLSTDNDTSELLEKRLQKTDSSAGNLSSSQEETNKFIANSSTRSAQESNAPKGTNVANLNLTMQKSSIGIDPTLMSAYQALQRGDFPQSQQLYRQVLKLDQKNVDALLGMATIAQKQSRDADAIGWYQKVLEIEPNNPIALAAMMNTQPNIDNVSKESHLKSLISQQPEVANFHAELGNLYASQNQWQQAQAAYFNAYRFAPNNADYAFNLAISLDQLGQKNLALTHYQHALDLVQQTGASSPNKATLEARIHTLQP